MTGVSHSEQAIRGDNPLRQLGWTNVGIAVAKETIALPMLVRDASAFQSGVGSAFGAPSLALAVLVIELVVCLYVAATGGNQLMRGIGQLGKLIVPPRAPADFSDFERDLAIPMKRRELPAYRIPKEKGYGLAHRLFPQQFPLLTLRLRTQLSEALEGVVSAALWIGATLLAFWALGFGLLSLPGGVRPEFPVLVLSGLLTVAIVRLWFVVQQFPSNVPTTDRAEFTITMRGGGDPGQIPIGIEYVLLARRPDSGAPNRAARIGFGETAGGVVDAGTYSGTVIVETQPEITSAGSAHNVRALFIAAVAAAVLALYLSFVVPDYLLRVAVPQSQEGTLLIARWATRLIGAQLLFAAERSALGQAEHFLSVFRFRSTAVAVNVEGTYGKAEVKVGKGIHDSIQSQNLVVRSDSAVMGYVADIQSESIGLMGQRYIVSSRRDDSVAEVRQIVEAWFVEFAERGADIVGVDLGSGKVSALVQANVAVGAQRAGVKASAVDERNRSRELDSRERPGLQDGANKGVDRPRLLSAPDDREFEANSKECPECAETVRAAAKKCRYCGYRFGGEDA